MPNPKIEHLLIQGDSLSDRGTLDKKDLFELIPMKVLAGLKGESPKGRFTNGLTWDDHLAAMIASELDIEALEKQSTQQQRTEPQDERNADEGDEIVSHAAKVSEPLSEKYHYSLEDDVHVYYNGENLVDTYAEGGLTSHSYKGSLIDSDDFLVNPSRFGARFAVSSLEAKRQKALEYARVHNHSETHRAETLVMEWSGANDIMTVNQIATPKEVERAVEERIKNIEEMIKHGYKHFMLFDLPDLSLTPRYQAMTVDERDNAKEASNTFNLLLHESLRELQQKYKERTDLSFDLFPVSELFTKVYKDPAQYGFDPKKIQEPYIKSEAFKTSGDHIKDSGKHIFWDDVHPSAHMHKILALEAYKAIQNKYNFRQPEGDIKESMTENATALARNFKLQYMERFQYDKHRFFGGMRRSRFDRSGANLKDILRHALYEGGDRSFDIIKKLQWFQGDAKITRKNIINKSLTSLNPELTTALDSVIQDHQRQQTAQGHKK